MDPTQLNHHAFYYSPLLHLRLHVRLNRQTKIHFNTCPDISALLDLSSFLLQIYRNLFYEI